MVQGTGFRSLVGRIPQDRGGSGTEMLGAFVLLQLTVGNSQGIQGCTDGMVIVGGDRLLELLLAIVQVMVWQVMVWSVMVWQVIIWNIGLRMVNTRFSLGAATFWEGSRGSVFPVLQIPGREMQGLNKHCNTPIRLT
jgi:hypothetical protein